MNNLPTFAEMRRTNRKDRTHTYQESRPSKGCIYAIGMGFIIALPLACLIGILIIKI